MVYFAVGTKYWSMKNSVLKLRGDGALYHMRVKMLLNVDIWIVGA